MGSGPFAQNRYSNILKRDTKDIIVVASSCGSFMLNLFNGVPVKEFLGEKLDLSFFSLARYLKRMKDCKDVRLRIKEDFYPSIANSTARQGGVSIALGPQLDGSGMISGRASR